ncbi:MAG: T9SS type A sorting domain-containing protein, partial [Sphingomonadales bacterium]
GTTWSNIAGATTTSFTLPGVIAAMSGNRYRCQVWNSTCTTPVVSNASLLTVRVVPGIGLAAAPLTSLLPGQQTTLTASPSATTGGVMTTQWTYNGQGITPLNNTYLATVNGLGDYQASIRETWPSGLFCSAISQVVTITANVSSRLFIYPSPNDGNFTLAYYYSQSGTTSRQVNIYDTKGALVYQQRFTISGAYTLLPIEMPAASAGIYLIVIGDASGLTLASGKVVIQ